MNTPNGRVTLKNIAESCGYSVNTVSRALRGDPRLPEDTIVRIQTAADKLGYIRNIMASSLRSGKSSIIAVIIEDIQNQHYSYLLNEISSRLNRKGYRVMILSNAPDDDARIQMAEYALSLAVDGILFFPALTSIPAARILQKNHIPMVLVDREIDGFDADVVRLDDYAGGRMAAETLTSMGHRNLLYLQGPRDNGSQPLRQQGFLDALAEQGIPEGSVIKIRYSSFLRAISEQNLDELLFPVEYSAIFSFNDQMAYYAMNCFRENDIRVPEDISILGFDNIRKDFPYLLPLTTLGAGREYDMADTVVNLMLERIEQPDLPPIKKILPVSLYEGGTCRKLMP